MVNCRGYYNTHGYVGISRLGKRVYPWRVYPPGTRAISLAGCSSIYAISTVAGTVVQFPTTTVNENKSHKWNETNQQKLEQLCWTRQVYLLSIPTARLPVRYLIVLGESSGSESYTTHHIHMYLYP